MKRLCKRWKRFDWTMVLPFIIFTAYALTLIYPFFYLIVGSLKGSFAFFDDPLGMPKHITWDNFKDVFFHLEEVTAKPGFTLGTLFYNSITLSGGLTLFSMMLQAMAAYILAKYDFKGNRVIYMAIIIASMVPTVGALPATFKLMTGAHLSNTYYGMLFLQGSAFGGCFLYLHAYFKAIPWSYAEVAMIDGASHFKVFTRIMVPLASKALKTYSVICFLGFWNDYWLPSLFYDEYPTLAVGLTHISSAALHSGNYPLWFAAMLVVVCPVLIFFALFQKQLLGSVAEGGLKE